MSGTFETIGLLSRAAGARAAFRKAQWIGLLIGLTIRFCISAAILTTLYLGNHSGWLLAFALITALSEVVGEGLRAHYRTLLEATLATMTDLSGRMDRLERKAS